MDLKRIFKDDDAVSPVIGVILMVAITVILAAVIASFVLNLGEETQTAQPQASFSFDYNQSSSTSDNLTITHESGDDIEAAKLNASVQDAVDTAASGPASFGDTGSNDGGTLYNTSNFSTVNAGTSDTIDHWDFQTTGPVDLSEATVRITYEDESTGSSTTLATWEGPDA